MKPIRLFTHAVCEPPGYLATLLERLGYPYEQVCLYDGVSVPEDLDAISALAIMGGPGNVNEPTDWMSAEIELIKRAYAQDVPVLGVCLGAQLMSKALGGKVWQGDAVEVGWHEVQVLADARWHPSFMRLPERFLVFQWHAHVFSPPPGAQQMAISECTDCQAYVLGKNLAMQFHLEMTETIIRDLIQQYGSDLQGNSSCVQSGSQILDNIDIRVKQINAMADAILTPWLETLAG